MKKLHFFGLLALTVVLALGMGFIACSSDSDDDGGDVPGDDFLRVTGTIDGKASEAIISKSSRAAYNIASGDYYVIRFIDGDVISRGRIEWRDPNIDFIPEDGSAGFTGYYSAGTLKITGIPYADKVGGWTLGAASTSGGGGNISNPGSNIPVYTDPAAAKTAVDTAVGLLATGDWAKIDDANAKLMGAQNLIDDIVTANGGTAPTPGADPAYDALAASVAAAVTALQASVQASASAEAFATWVASGGTTIVLTEDGSGYANKESYGYYVGTKPTLGTPTGGSWTGTVANNVGPDASRLAMTHPVGNDAADAVTYTVFLMPTVQLIIEWPSGAEQNDTVTIEYTTENSLNIVQTTDLNIEPYNAATLASLGGAAVAYPTGAIVTRNDFVDTYDNPWFTSPTITGYPGSWQNTKITVAAGTNNYKIVEVHKDGGADICPATGSAPATGAGGLGLNGTDTELDISEIPSAVYRIVLGP